MRAYTAMCMCDQCVELRFARAYEADAIADSAPERELYGPVRAPELKARTVDADVPAPTLSKVA